MGFDIHFFECRASSGTFAALHTLFDVGAADKVYVLDNFGLIHLSPPALPPKVP